jgi:hypothetical protein
MAKFYRRGISEIHFAPAVTDLAAPSRPQITAGVELSPGVAAIAGFQLSNAPIPVPNLKDQFTPQIDGEDTIADSTLTFNDDVDDDEIRTTLAKGTTGFLILMPYGDVAAARCEVWPVKVSGFNDTWDLGATPAQAVAGFVVTGVPEQNAVVPAP